MKTILYLIISLLLIMCYIERQKSQASAPAKGAAGNQVSQTGPKPDQSKQKQKKMPSTAHHL